MSTCLQESFNLKEFGASISKRQISCNCFHGTIYELLFTRHLLYISECLHENIYVQVFTRDHLCARDHSCAGFLQRFEKKIP